MVAHFPTELAMQVDWANEGAQWYAFTYVDGGMLSFASSADEPIRIQHLCNAWSAMNVEPPRHQQTSAHRAVRAGQSTRCYFGSGIGVLNWVLADFSTN